jgi:glycine hydroxymethyltransferase
VALLDADGEVLSMGLIQRPGFRSNRYHLVVPADRVQKVVNWLRHLSDGYVLFDKADLWAKLPGPVVVRDLGSADELVAEEGLTLDEATFEPPVSRKPYFIGLSAEGYEEPEGEPLPAFDFSPFDEHPSEDDLIRTPLYDWHVEHGARMAPFAGWEMPLWYTSISDEHRAVRGAAGLFDVSHMGVLDVSGPHAAYFLNLVTVNDVNALRPGEAQYSYFLRPDGRVIDDLFIYRLTPARYLLVVNAANTEKDWAWLQAVNRREVQIDMLRPWVRTAFQADLRNLHTSDESYAWLADLALQGPRSRDILLALIDAAPSASHIAELRSRLMALKRTEVTEMQIPSRKAAGGMFDLIIARTGYTGERMGFEIFVHPDAIRPFWEQLLEVGGPFGLRPVGLGARDSLRIEAGLPLYGHELAGPLDLRPDDAGFSGYVKVHKPFFVGRRAYIKHAQERKMKIVRFRIEEKVRVPKQGDAVTESHGRVIGQVTSCAMGTEGSLVGQAYLDQRYAEKGTAINIFPHPTRGAWDKPYEELEVGDRVTMYAEAEVISRFMR